MKWLQNSYTKNIPETKAFFVRFISKHLLKITAVILLSLSSNLSYSQWFPPCEEPSRVNQYFQCQEPMFRPVCGCNYITYRNECVSYNIFGINWVLSNGICQNDVFEFDFYPNPSSEIINFSLEYFDQGNMTLQIFDTYGKLMYLNNKASVKRFDDIIQVGSFRPGLYIVTVISGNLYKAKKLIVR